MAKLFDLAKKYADAHPKRSASVDGSGAQTSWQGYCQSLMWRMCNSFGKAPSPAPNSARNAWKAAGKLNPDHLKAKVGSFHYWSIGEYDHVGLDLRGKGLSVFMASNHIAVKWGDAIGYISVAQYNKVTGAKYLGWSKYNGKNGKITKNFG